MHVGFFSILVSMFLAGLVQADIKRTASGNPDLSGFYDSGTLTPLNRPKELSEKKFMTRAEAEILKKMSGLLQSDADKVSDPNREAPPSGGDGEHGFGAGGVGGPGQPVALRCVAGEPVLGLEEGVWGRG